MDIKVKDLIEFLQKFDGNTLVYLDHDGWMEDQGNTPIEVIDNRGLFSHYPPKDDKKLDYLVINN